MASPMLVREMGPVVGQAEAPPAPTSSSLALRVGYPGAASAPRRRKAPTSARIRSPLEGLSPTARRQRQAATAPGSSRAARHDATHPSGTFPASSSSSIQAGEGSLSGSGDDRSQTSAWAT